MGKRIVLVVREEVGCPLFRAGDRMVLDLPGIDPAASANVCTLAVAKLLAERRDPSCEDMTAPTSAKTLLCPRSAAPVLFDVLEHEGLPTWTPMLGALARDPAQAVSVLRTVPIFRSLPTPALQRLAEKIQIERHAAGATVVEKGTLGRAYFIVYDGELEVVDYADSEVSSVLSRLKPRDGFGEMSLLTGAPTAANVVAIGDVTLLALPKDDFERLLRDSPYVASSFTRLLAARLMATNSLLVKEGAKPFSGKLQEMSLPTVLQVLGDSNRSGTLHLDDYQGSKGRIGFSHGRPFVAELGALRGEAAIFEALRWSKGDFWLDKKDVPETDEIDQSVMSLLLEGMRRIDESNRGGRSSGAGVPEDEDIEVLEDIVI